MPIPNPIKRRVRVGDWVEVRPLAEIVTTLDANGRLDGLPFMPEMVRYCGRRFRVLKSAHKTCDPTGQSNLRRMDNAVHLSTRCDGSGHDGCEARCLLFWKTAWLRLVDDRPSPSGYEIQQPTPAELDRLHCDTRYTSYEDSEVRYRCQATEIVNATVPLGSRDVGQYFLDLSSGNVAPWRFARYFARAVWDLVASRMTRASNLFRDSKPASLPTPSASAQNGMDPAFEPGEFVKVKPVREIALTLDREGKNRGLSFEREMERYSGKTFRVDYRPAQIIDERTGRKIRLGKNCIVLEGLVCAGLDNRGRLFCPRSSYFYWRAAWLDRADPSPNVAAESQPPVRDTQSGLQEVPP